MLLGLLLLLWIAIQQAPVQNFIVQKITTSLSKTLGTEVRIGRVEFDFFNRVTIEEVYTEDHNRDTLLSIDRLSADIGLFSLLKQSIHLDNVEVNDLSANISKSATDSLFNFNFILEAFASDSTAPAPDASASGANWDIQVGMLNFTDINFTYKDSVQQLYFATRLPKAIIDVDHLDLGGQKVHVNKINLTEPLADLSMISMPGSTESTPLAFPYTGWDLVADELKIGDGEVRYWVENVESLPERFDVNHLAMDEIILNVSDFSWDSTAMDFSLQTLAAKDHSGLVLSDGKVDFSMNLQEIIVDQLVFVTPNSTIKNTSNLKFSDWSKLNDFITEVNLETRFSESELALQDLEYFIPYIPKDYRISESIRLNGKLSLVQANAQVDNLKIQIGNILNLRTSGAIRRLSTPEALGFDMNVQQLNLNYKKLRTSLPVLNLPDMIDSLGRLQLSGQIAGNADSIGFKQLTLKTDANTSFKSDGWITNLSAVNQLRFDLEIDSLSTRAEDLAFFTPAALPPGLYDMQRINYSGLLKGGLTEFFTKGILTTAIGSLQTNIGINFNEDYSDATYDGKIELESFDLGKFLQDTTTFGTTSLEASLEGQGIVLDSLDTRVDAVISNLHFSGYNYQRIKINGTLEDMQFRGEAGMEDQNLTFDFRGLVDLNEDAPIFEFEVNLDTLDLSALNLSDIPLRVSAAIESNFTGNNIDAFLGSAIVKDLYMSDTVQTFYLDSLIVKAKTPEQNEKVLEIKSDLLVANFEGDFRLMDVPVIFKNYINDYFPVENFISPIDQPEELALEPYAQRELPDQDLRFKIQVYDPTRVTQLFTDVLTQLDSAILTGSFRTSEKTLKANLDIPLIEVAGWTMDSLRWRSSGDTKLLGSNFKISKLSNGATTILNPIIETSFANNQLSAQLKFDNPQEETAFVWGGILSPEGDLYRLRMNDSLLIDQQLWNINPEQDILFGTGYLRIKDFDISKNDQVLTITSFDRSTDKDYTPIAVDFKNFKLGEVSALTNIDGFDFGGLLNGSIILNDISKNLHYLADLQVDDLMVNDSLIGQIELTAEQTSDRPVIDIGLALKGQGNELTADGEYNIASNAIGLDADVKRIPLILLDPFTLGSIKNSSGYLTGSLKVNGAVNRPDVNGYLQFQEASTTIDYLKTRYTIPNGKINISNDRFEFENMRFVDRNKNEAQLEGYVSHDYFESFQFNLGFDTDRFVFLNTKAGDNELFYGQLNLAADVAIKGTLKVPVINIVAKTLTGSKLFVSAIVDEQVNSGADYVIYGEPGAIPLDSLLENVAGNAYGAPEIDMLLNLNLTPAAELIVVVDPVSGDQLSSKGNANLTIKLTPSGEVDIQGIYTAESGAYQFSYQNLVKREFSLRQGSTLNFIGDPLDTRFDITATYTTKTSLYPLISNESNLSEADQSAAKDRASVDVYLSMEGDLDRPELAFDIQLDEDEVSSGVNTVVTQKLSRLREDEAELNKQVFGLLLLNSFVAEQSATAGLSTAGENIALSSVSSLISNQLNRLSERYLDGLGLTFDLESYRAQIGDEGSETTRTNLNVGLSRTIFNDRLTIKVGGVVQVDNGGGSANSSGFSNIAGDFVLEYQLDKSGNYLLRVFQRSDYDAFDDANSSKTGAGISFKKSFGQ